MDSLLRARCTGVWKGILTRTRRVEGRWLPKLDSGPALSASSAHRSHLLPLAKLVPASNVPVRFQLTRSDAC